jgi:hypothetical protein
MGKVWRMKADSDRCMPNESGSEAKPPRWVVAASTRDAEEALLIDQWLNLASAEREDRRSWYYEAPSALRSSRTIFRSFLQWQLDSAQ